MAAGDRPRIKVAIKPKDGGGGRISICAAWDGDNGKLSASLDRRITELAIKLDDGSVVRVKRGADGKPDHWIDVFEEGSAPRQAAPAGSVDAAKRAAKAMVSDVFEGAVDDTDDLPF